MEIIALIVLALILALNARIIDGLQGNEISPMFNIEPQDDGTDLMTPDQLDGAENTISDIAAHFRPLAPELAIVSNGGFNGETAAAAVASGRSDAVAFGRAFILAAMG